MFLPIRTRFDKMNKQKITNVYGLPSRLHEFEKLLITFGKIKQQNIESIQDNNINANKIDDID